MYECVNNDMAPADAEEDRLLIPTLNHDLNLERQIARERIGHTHAFLRRAAGSAFPRLPGGSPPAETPRAVCWAARGHGWGWTGPPERRMVGALLPPRGEGTPLIRANG